jgi:hypothetical protein
VLRIVPLVAALACVLGGCDRVAAEPVALTVRITLTDADYGPLPTIDGRVAFASDGGWSSVDAGLPFSTDAKGTATLTANVVLDRGERVLPSLGGFARVLARPLPYEHVRVGVTLTHAGEPLRYVVDASSFDRGGTVALDDFRIYARGADGRFDREVHRQNDDGTIVAALAYEVTDYNLAPGDAPGAWTLDLAFKRLPEPVRYDR